MTGHTRRKSSRCTSASPRTPVTGANRTRYIFLSVSNLIAARQRELTFPFLSLYQT